MKLVTFRTADRKRIGALVEGDQVVVDFSDAGFGPSMIDLIATVRPADPRLTAALDGPRFAMRDVEILAPIPRPRRNLFCVGKNYHEHAAEFGRSGFDAGAIGGSEVPDAPIIFTKPPSTVIGPGRSIESALDPYASVDYEAEIAVVVGRRGRVAEADDPMDFVFGYTILNDVTSRELQKRHKQWVLGKGIDTFGPLGPAILTADEVPDPAALSIRLWVNGELRQSASVGDLIFDVPTLIRTIGRVITLEPGDIVATGTPVGVGIGFKPPRYLVPGDTVRIEVPALGVLENPVS